MPQTVFPGGLLFLVGVALLIATPIRTGRHRPVTPSWFALWSLALVLYVGFIVAYCR